MKVISKLITAILAPISLLIIFEEHSDFTKGRNISNNILLAHEMLQKIDAEIQGGNIVFKLDLIMAYDRISWLFINKVLRQFGFGKQMIDMVWWLIPNCWYSLIINGQIYGFLD